MGQNLLGQYSFTCIPNTIQTTLFAISACASISCGRTTSERLNTRTFHDNGYTAAKKEVAVEIPNTNGSSDQGTKGVSASLLNSLVIVPVIDESTSARIVSSSEIQLFIGTSVIFSACQISADSSCANLEKSAIAWESSDTSIIVMGDGSRLTAHRTGRATITAKYHDARSSMTVVVPENSSSSIALSLNSAPAF